jgi:hypothetical protein
MGYPMRYDVGQDRWVVDLDDGSEYPLHCGDGVSIYFSNSFFRCRIEFGREWYICIGNVKFNLRKQEKYRVMI